MPLPEVPMSKEESPSESEPTKRLHESPRTQILYLLRKSEKGLSTEELCSLLNVTPMAVHRQLKRLEEQGFVTSEIVRQSRGRPLHIYKLTEATEGMFPTGYMQLLMELLGELKRKDGSARLRRLFQSRFKKFAAAHKDRIEQNDLSETVNALCNVLNENGYMAEVDPTESGGYVIKLHNCPISKVARQFPEVCSCEQSSLNELMHADVKRDQHILRGHNYCSYRIDKK
jgi:predicted ArsR family transcriptional regulator